MWKAQAGMNIQVENNEDDDWETDPDFVNDVTEQEQRWGSKTIEGSGRTAGAIDMQKLRSETEQADRDKKRKQLEEQNPGYGYGGKFGVQKDRVDKSAAGWDHIEKVEKHASQKDYSEGFGGKFGVQKDRVDKSAAGWDHIEKVEKHASQKDYATGFGGKFGVQSDRVDKSAVGWDHVEKVEKHESQVDHKVGFGGKFGVQKDRMDKSAAGYEDSGKQQVGTTYTKVKPNIEGAKPSNLRAKFENLAKNNEEDTRKRAEEQKQLRAEKDRRDREEAAKKTIIENTPLPAADEARPVPAKGSRSIIATGREGGIGNAISAFNQMQSPTTETPPPRKEPIVIPKETKQKEEVSQQEVSQPPIDVKEVVSNEIPAVAAPVVASQPPDVIPSVEAQKSAAAALTPPPPVTAEIPTVTATALPSAAVIDEPLYQNRVEAQEQQLQQEQQPQPQSQPQPQQQQEQEQRQQTQTTSVTETSASAIGTEEAIYANSDNLADYIEDTGLRAIALYDYQAMDDDEISFDPDDEVSHIEMIDEGWWRGLCKNRYGLFPANYVQLINKP